MKITDVIVSSFDGLVLLDVFTSFLYDLKSYYPTFLL